MAGVERQVWVVEVGFRPHTVELDEYSDWTGIARSFRSDGVRVPIGGRNPLGRRHSTTFRIGGRPAEMTRTQVGLPFVQQLRRTFGSSLRRLPLTIVGHVIGGAGIGGGLAASHAASGALGWAIYSLSVNGALQGSWVATLVGGTPREWRFVEPGGSLPDGRTPWGARRTEV